MEIEGRPLTPNEIWEPVTYIPGHADGDPTHPDCEKGILKSWNQQNVFCVFYDSRRAQACSPGDLRWG